MCVTDNAYSKCRFQEIPANMQGTLPIPNLHKAVDTPYVSVICKAKKTHIIFMYSNEGFSVKFNRYLEHVLYGRSVLEWEVGSNDAPLLQL